MYKIWFITTLNFVTLVYCDNECGLDVSSCNNHSKYRSIDGSCNNLKQPKWGTTHSVYDRILPPKYADGIHAFTKASNGKELPNARKLTSEVFVHGIPETTSEFNLNAMQYGQIVTHDMSFNFLPLPGQACCTNFLRFFDKKDEPKECANIHIPSVDPFYGYVNATCLSMARTITSKDKSCSESIKHAEQLTNANNYLDLSIIYGQTYEIHKTLRTYKDGTLKVDVRNNQEWLPKSDQKGNSEVCEGNLNSKEWCYHSGDPRTNQNPQLTVLVILLVRNHNNLARSLKQLNPHWDDDRLFEEARRINIAEHQNIVYYELLPIYLGKKNMLKKNILHDNEGFVNDYDENVRPHVFNEHAQAAFRQFHSLIAGKLSLMNPSGCPYDSLVLRDHFNRPQALEKYKIFDGLIRGLATQPQMLSDIYYDPEMTRHAFMLNLRFGTDIKSTDIHRSRDHGLASYNDMRAYCGLKKAKKFEDFLDKMDKDKVDTLVKFYESPDDVDLIVGGSFEKNVEGTLAGPTFLCIMYKQFYKTRRSDRFWFENEQNGLTLEQLKEIRKFTVSKLFCDNGYEITHMQKNGFLVVSESNPRHPCSFIKGPNITLWKE